VIVDMLSALGEFEHARIYLANARTPHLAAPSLAVGLTMARRESRHADLLHVVGDTSALLCAPLFKRHRAVWGTHGLHLVRRVEGLTARLVRSRVKAAIAASQSTVCSSPQEFRELSAIAGAGLAPKLCEVPNAVPLGESPTAEERRDARREFGLNDHDFVALFLGETEDRKRPLDATDAVGRLAGRGIPAVLLVAGSGSLEATLAAQGNWVRVLGFQSDRLPLFAAADVFLIPSEREGLSLALLEAMAHGLAIVASDAAGNADVIGEAGLLHPVGDTESLTEILVGLAMDPGQRHGLAQLARARAEKEFSFDRYLDAMRGVFESAVV
jgi:glycosyltransferase involved in cell wall biosynthesis